MHDNQGSQFDQLRRALKTGDASQWLIRSAKHSDTTWAGLWPTSYRNEALELIAHYVQRLDGATVQRLHRSGRLPGLRDIKHLIGVVIDEGNDVDINTLLDQSDDSHKPIGIPIFDHGVLDQAHLSEVRQATHVVRVLDDYHEPTLAKIRRRLLRELDNPDDTTLRQAVGAQAIEIFLKTPVRWRDVVETALLKRMLKAIETELGDRIRGPRRTNTELCNLITVGLTMLFEFEGEMAAAAKEIQRNLQIRQERLAASRHVLMYEEHDYLQLSGVIAGRSVRRHLPRGLHVVFSDQIHRRSHRIAGLWLDASDDEHSARPYYYAPNIPPAYASRQKPEVLRLPDEDALRRYIEDLS